MKKLSVLVASVLAAAFASAAIASPASATVFCSTAPANHICPSAYGIGTPFKASLEPGTSLVIKGGYATANCKKSELIGSVSGAYRLTYSSGTSSECGVATVETFARGLTAFWNEGTHDGSVYQSIEWVVKANGSTCVYGPAGTEGQTITGGNPAKLKINIWAKKLTGDPFCANPASVTATYLVNSPAPFYVEKE